MGTLNPLINRYRDLNSLIPDGEFYASDGNIVPYRNSPYDVRFTTEVPNRKFGVFLNNVFQGVVTADPSGNVVVSVQLNLGENVVEIVDSITQERTQSFLSAKHYATWLAAYATEFERIDNNIDTVQMDANLAQCFESDLEIVWGIPRNDQPNPGYDGEVYRNLLQEVHQARRLFGAKVKGHEVALGAFCQIPPLDWFRRTTGKRWVLAFTFLQNRNFRTQSNTTVPAFSISGISLTSLSEFASSGSATLGWNPGLQQISYTDAVFGTFTINIQPNRSGVYNVLGPSQAAAVVANTGPYVFGSTTSFIFQVDHKGPVVASIIAGTYSAATLATLLNSVLNADPRYGSSYSTVFGTFSGGPRLRATSVLAGPSASIILYNSGGTTVLFGAITQPQEVDGYQDTIATFNVVLASLPSITTSQTVAIVKAPLPNGWFVVGGTTTLQYRVPKFQTSLGTLQVRSLGADITISTKVLSEAFNYIGFPFILGTWLWTLSSGVNIFLGWSFDGSTWNESAALPLTATTDPYALATFLQQQFILDPYATQFWIRIRASTGGSPFTINIDSTQLIQPQVSGAFLGQNTIPRSRHREFFGHLLLAWCPDRLNAEESLTSGLGPPPVTPVGQLDYIGAAHTQLDRFVVTEFDPTTNLPLNIGGIINEADWVSCALTNLEVVSATPSRFTHVVPTVAGSITDNLIFTTVSPWNATLSVVSDQNQPNAILFQDGIPVTQDQWTFVGPQTINVSNAAFSPSSLYSIRYNALYQATSSQIDLGTTWSNYVWFIDHYTYSRFSADRVTVPQNVPLFLDFGTNTATLDRPADTDIDASTIIRTSGTEVFELPRGAWQFLSPLIISIDSQYVVKGALYQLTYNEVGMNKNAIISTVLQIRSASSLSGLSSAIYKIVSRNTAVRTQGLRYHQLQITFSGCQDLRDFRCSSCVLKGLNIFGVGGVVPGVRP